ncbi:MAG: hypothetical protein KF773_15890 [Deltaproteobacteria bacterium]|nr:hypothetical protein [Deltaproteobacteria bacterium]
MKITTILAAAAILTTAAPAIADPVVLAVDGADIYVDLGAADGVGAGAQLELQHEVVAKDPRNGATLRDHFTLGTLTVEKSGDRVSVARAGDALRERVLAGDRVRLISPRKKLVDPWLERTGVRRDPATAPPPPPVVAGGPPIDHAELARAAWQDTLGKPLAARVDRWLALLAADPHSPYRVAVQREIQTLRAQITAREAALASARTDDPSLARDRSARIAQLVGQLQNADSLALLLAGPVGTIVAGQPIDLSFAVRSPVRVGKAWLYARPKGEVGFKRSELVPDGDAYLRGRIDAALVTGSAVEWYVEVATRDEPEAVLGSQATPRSFAVERTVAEAPIATGRSHVDMHYDYVDFDGGFNKGYDQYYQAELDFTYRFLEPVYAVRLGFGTLAGVGGPKDVIDADPAGRCLDGNANFRCTRVNFNYVYTELEFRLRKNVAIMLRPQAGLLTTDEDADKPANRCTTRDVDGCRFLTGLGARARLRLGEETGTNLVIGAGFTDGVGTLLEASYNWRPNPVVPVQLSVQVTDQPVVEDLGVRLIADVGWRSLSWFYPSVRVSYQARDLDHAGVSGGVAMNFDW